MNQLNPTELNARIKRTLRNQPRTNTPLLVRSSASLSRSPEEVEAELAKENQHYAFIGAAIDFIHRSSEDALKQQTRKLLGIGYGNGTILALRL